MPNPITEQIALTELMSAIVECLTRATPTPEITFRGHHLYVTVHGSDQGRMVGANGAVIWAIQTVFHYAGIAENGYPMELHLMEPTATGNRSKSPYRPNPKWNRKLIGNLINLILISCIRSISSPYVIAERTTTRADVTIRLEKYIQMQLSYPSFTDAVESLVHAAGKAQGVNLAIAFEWR